MTYWRWAALAALGVIGCTIGFAQIPGIAACGRGDAIMAFEFVTSPGDVARLFPASCRAVHVAAQYRGLALDSFGFIPIYSSFLILCLLALHNDGRAAGRGVVRAAIGMTLLAAACDQFEGVQLYRLLGHLPGDQHIIKLLMPAVRIKFALLALVVIAIGGQLFRRGGWHVPVAVLLIAGSAVSLAGLFGNRALVMQGSSLAWLVLITVVLIKAVRTERAT
ncbi:hypothetical protein QH494_15530 [Sphingomonas sp. AR_OL41]|uniref:hypothetical protein n=1 Tax=Sphingomonas sp. AR_OL41 TaxID=3042729 RepID=UPI00247FDC52|nr:hypothetical protein [Sphingomonas sp. AR_OL41]MDH7973602.1 hypothetical protein [Sphingomonas sp. AR_OL41]